VSLNLQQWPCLGVWSDCSAGARLSIDESWLREHYYLRPLRFYVALRGCSRPPMQCFSILEMAKYIVRGSQKSFYTFTLSREDMRYNTRRRIENVRTSSSSSWYYDDKHSCLVNNACLTRCSAIATQQRNTQLHPSVLQTSAPPTVSQVSIENRRSA